MNIDPSLKDFEEVVKPFAFHGVALTKTNDQAVGDCPFCDASARFYIALREKTNGEKKTAPGMWSCRKCSSQGNLYSFWKELHSASLNQTTQKDWKRLGELRKLDWKIFQEYRLAVSTLLGDWLYPTFNREGSLNGLYKWPEPKGEKKTKVFNSGGHTLLGLETLREDSNIPIMVCEGHWDRPAMDLLMRTAGVREDYDLLAVPGAGTFKDQWCPYFKDRPVIFIYHNDHPKENPKTKKITEAGKDGMKRAIHVLVSSGNAPSSVRQIVWPEGLKDGYDIRDLVSEGIPA